MELGGTRHSLDPVREALHEFEEAVVAREHRSLMGESKAIKQQAADRAREHVIEEIMQLVRRTIAEREGNGRA